MTRLDRLAAIVSILGAVLWVASDAKWFAAIADAVEDVPVETVISGPALVLGGRHVSVAGTKIVLVGIDVAELGTIWGDRAKAGLGLIVGGLIATGELSCRVTGYKNPDPKYSNWEYGTCTKPDGTDIAEKLVADGFALACPRYDDRYVKFEAKRQEGSQPRSSYCTKEKVR